MKKYLILAISTFAIIFIGVALADWNQGPPNPPNGDAPVPINAGAVYQEKSGGLVINRTGGAGSTGLWVPSGNVNIGALTMETTHKLEVTGNIMISGATTNGIVFSDGSKVTGVPITNCTYLGWNNTTKKFTCN